MDMLALPPSLTTLELSPSPVISLKEPLTAFLPMAILFSADEAERASSPRATESLPFAFALTPMATASSPAAAASSPVELARKYFIPGFVWSKPKAEFTFFSSVISVLFCWMSLEFWLILILLLAISVLLSAILSLLAAISVWFFCTSFFTASTSTLVATPSVDIVIVFVVSSLVTEMLVPAFKISPSWTSSALP